MFNLCTQKRIVKDKDTFEVEERLYPATMMACTEKVVKGKLTVADMEQG